MDQEARAIVTLEDDDGRGEADYGYGMHHSDRRRAPRVPSGVTVSYECAQCGFTTPSRGEIWRHASGHALGTGEQT